MPSTVLPDMDFETYSEAGLRYVNGKWVTLPNSSKRGMFAVGGVAYAEHPSTEVLSLAYDLKDGKGARLWFPGMAAPDDLFRHIQQGGLIEAWNSAFEYHIWHNVCYKRMGWPALPYAQLRDAMAKARAFSVPGGLDKAAKVLNAEVQKLSEGKRLIKKFSMPRNPTKRDERTRILPMEDLVDAVNLYRYNITDIKAEAAVSAKMPDLPPEELKLWLLDQKINIQGVQLDIDAREDCESIVLQATEKYTEELRQLTGGVVRSANENAKMLGWLGGAGVTLPNMQADTVSKALKNPNIPANVKRVLEIRASLGAASVKKLFAMGLQVSQDGRLKGLFAYCGADRTGRFAGRGPQPQNLPNSGLKVSLCKACDTYYGGHRTWRSCPYCKNRGMAKQTEWCNAAVEDALRIISTRDLSVVEYYFGDAIAAVAGCLRGLFVPAPGHDFICSDYSAIEAVVLAQLAGEEWRLEVFRTHGKIYEMSASKITGIPFEEFLRHKEETGEHHPMRKKIGKISELASGYQGGVGAWKNFGADKHLSEQEIKNSIQAWRKDSPNIVKFWHKIEELAISAVQIPGHSFQYRGILFHVHNDVLYCKLLSGRTLKYHTPRLHLDVTPWGKEVQKLTYMGVDSLTKQWVRLDTYGGKLTENITQATARDILTHAMINLDRVRYNIVLHVHDEVVCEVPKGFGSIEELENIMATVPHWADGWPLRAAGGWRGQRYRKD